MPATILSHQALVLPLKMRWPHRFSGLALCIGSMTPDLAFIGTMTDDSVFSHTVSAQLWFTAPVTIALVWIITALVLPALLPYLRDHPTWRLHDLAALEPPRGWRGWSSVALSAAIGGFSHVLVDGITHGNHSGWLVPSLPWLRTMVPQIGGSVPLYDALQVWLTILFAVASAVMWRDIARRRLLWQWRGKRVSALPRMSRAAGQRLLLACGLAALQGAFVGWSLHRDHALKQLAAGIGFGTIDFALVALLLAAIAVRLRASRTASAIRTPSPSAGGVPA